MFIKEALNKRDEGVEGLPQKVKSRNRGVNGKGREMGERNGDCEKAKIPGELGKKRAPNRLRGGSVSCA